MLACAHALVTQVAEVSVNPSRHRMHCIHDAQGIFASTCIQSTCTAQSEHTKHDSDTVGSQCAGGRRRGSRHALAFAHICQSSIDDILVAEHRMDVQECLAEVKLCAGKDVYKGTFLPLLRVYRQNQDVEKLTRGLRELAAPLLPNHRLTQALATLLPSALQHSFQQQLQVVKGPPQANTQNATKLPSLQHAKRQKVAHCPSDGPAKASHHASNVARSYVAPAPVTPKVEESCTPPVPSSKPAQAIHTTKQLEHRSQPLPTSATSAQIAARTQQNSSAAAGTAAQFRGNLKRIKDAETFQRQKERRQKKAAFLLDGTTTGPVVGVAKGSSWGQEPHQHPVRLQGGQLVQLPVRPNRSQVLLMQSITTALHQKRHALLESPTGTGKTLALLCASLAWQQQQAHAAAHKPDGAVPRIFWAARTHAQIDHAVHEVRRTSYRPMMTILASRERFCLHPDIAVAPNKTEACEGATMVGHMDCSYLENAEASWYPQGPEHLPAYKPGGRLETFDIEELVAEGKAGHVCPYHASRDVLNEGAALVFVTYSQLLDPPVRSANGLDDLMKGAVLVFDEAHNIAAECRAAATLQMSTADLEALALDLGGMQGSLNKMAPASWQWRHAADWARELAQLVDTMQKWLARQLSSTLPFQKEQGTGNSRAAIEVWEGSGQDAHDTVVHHLNLSVHRVETLQGRLKAMRRGLIEGGYESTAVKSGAINQLEGLLSKLLFVLQTGGLGYRCILSRQSTAGKARRGTGQVSDAPTPKGTAYGQGVPIEGSGPKGTAKGQAAPIEGSFSFLCLHAAVALTPLLPKAHSLLLTSGTLSPVAPLVAELGLGEKPKRQPMFPHGSVPVEPSTIGKGHMLSQLPQQQRQQPKQQEQQQHHKLQYGPADSAETHQKPGQKLPLPADAQPGCALLPQQAHITTAFSAQDLQSGPVGAVQPGKALPQSDMGQLVGLQPCLGKQEEQQVQLHQVAPQQQQSQQVQQQNEQVHQQQQEIQQQQHQQTEQQQQNQQVKQQQLQVQQQQQRQQQPARSQHARLHEGVELVSAPHHHTLPARLLPLTISMAPGYDGQLVKLDSAYERRQHTAYLDALGSAMLMLCRAVPNGVLCFFPSWGLLNAARDQWLVTGMYQHICACKEVVAEPSNVSGEVFDEAIKGYRQAAAKVSGALLMAVMRGRSSEGVDFLDDCARAVVVVGIPYPPLYETTVRLKRAFNRDHEALLGSGDDWYAAEAFRAVNQAIGRLIRHQKDYGAVILLDHRYNVLKFRQMTPAWLQPLLKSTAMADAPVLLHNFFCRTQSMK